MHPLKKLSNKKPLGIYSACTGNRIVIKAVLKRALETNTLALIESTSNQVNQYGGYTGMLPSDYRDFVYEIAQEVGFDKKKIILGGDHLGPLIWTDINPEVAMNKAEELVYEYVKAGFTKIHLDTSMKLLNDESLPDELIATRSMRLAKAAERAYDELLITDPEAIFPVFIVGSEVPIPGGAQEEETVTVTTTEALQKTYDTFKKLFIEHDVERTFNNIVGIVVQPGVEFGDEEIVRYNHNEAKGLTQYLNTNYETLVFEGHSTDYQTRKNMREMVEDGVSILKVGPGLTFALREALFGLNLIEEALYIKDSSHFIDNLESTMIENPENWKKHYHGTEDALKTKRKYSFSDRSRYYLNEEKMIQSTQKLLENFKGRDIPINIISQYFPKQYLEIINDTLKPSAEEIMIRHIEYVIDDYLYATQQRKF